MKTNTSLVASLTFLLSLGSLSSLGCSAADAHDPGDRATSAVSLSPTEDTSVIESAASAPYVLIAQTASGYVLTTLNSGATTTVTTLDLSAAGVDAIAATSALATPETIAARGTIRDGETFVASVLYRALPNAGAASQSAYYVAHTGPHEDTTTEVNVGKARVLHRLDVSEAAVPFVDEAWLSARVLEGGALVAGSLAAGVLHASAVFVRLPEIVTCTRPIETCSAGEIPTYERDANRCLVAMGCARHSMCPLYVPACASGYVRSSWPGARGCPTFACDPAFDPAP